MVLRTQTFSLFLLICLPCFSQRRSNADNLTLQNLAAHIKYLAGDELEGRRFGTRGEKLAQQYIEAAFRKEGLEPKGENGSYLQAFRINEGRFYQRSSYLIINEDTLSSALFFPLPASPDLTARVKCSIALKEIGVPWFLDIRDDLQAASGNPHFDLENYLSDKANSLRKKGASTVFAYNSDPSKPDAVYDPKDRSPAASIPVIYVTRDMAKKYFTDETATLRLQYSVAFTDSSRTGGNVLGFINNEATSTAIIGAHFDHLGYGEDGTSLFRTGTPQIHNGADDNASGVAAIIELARLLKKSRFKKNNYLFIAFTGEELGILGSKFFTEHPTIDLSTVNYMFNLDMVGRLNSDSKVLTVGGYGTSPSWGEAFKKVKARNDFVPKFDSSGTGPSDHTAFYQKNIPVLFFFTGTHSDYHKPSDDADKINYEGEEKIINYIYKLVEYLNKEGKISFTKTRETQMGTATAFSVTLGIMPDYSFEGAGVRIDGISEGRPAQKAGLQVGDVITELGEHRVSSLENYMQALGKFKSGDSAKVKVKRKDAVIEATVTF